MIGERLRKLRKEKGLNQEDLANIIGVQKSMVSLYELNKSDPSDKIKVAISRYFNISLDYLLGVIDDPVPYFTPNLFIRIPENLPEIENSLLRDYLEYLDYRTANSSDTAPISKYFEIYLI